MEIFKTKGIVLSTIPYNDKTSFVHIYTSEFGMMSYAVSSARSKKAKLQRSLFAPLTMLELEVEHKATRTAQKILEAQSTAQHYNLQIDPTKNAVSFFLAEFLDRVIQEHEANPSLYTYIENSITLFELIDEGKANFHLVFLAHLSRHLGLAINTDSYKEGYYFDLLDGNFVNAIPAHIHYLEPVDAKSVYTLYGTSFTDMATLQLSRDQRNNLLENIIIFFRLHLSDFRKLNSLEVLKVLF